MTTPVDKLLLRNEIENETEKKTKSGSRIINTERATFIHLVFTTAAITASECNKFNKRLAGLIANKPKELFGKILSYIETRISNLLKSILVSIHGVRDQCERRVEDMKNVSNVTFGIIPADCQIHQS